MPVPSQTQRYVPASLCASKEHRSWSIVESRRYSDGKVAQRHVLYLGEIKDSQRLAWEKTIEVFDERSGDHRQIALFPSDRPPPAGATEGVQVRLDALQLERPRHSGERAGWAMNSGACWSWSDSSLRVSR